MSDLSETDLAQSLKMELAKLSWTVAPWPGIRSRLFGTISGRPRPTGRRLLAAGGLALVATLAAGALVPQTRETALAFIGKELGVNWNQLTDPERQKVVDQTHERNATFLRDFLRRHADPRKLPVIKVQSEGIPPTTLHEAVVQADIIVRATVQNTRFTLNPDEGVPDTTASLTTVQIVKGNLPAAFEVRQIGGPIAQGSGGALAELDVDALLLPGDDVILLLRRGTDGSLRTLPGDGVLYVRGQVVRAEDGSPISIDVNGLGVAEVLRLLHA